MIKTLADEFMDIMNNINEGCTASRVEDLYNGIKEAEAKVKELTDLNSGLSEQAQGLDYCAEEAEKKHKDAEVEVQKLTLSGNIRDEIIRIQQLSIDLKNERMAKLEGRLAKAQSWKDNQLERLKDFYDTYHEIEGSQEYYDLKELEKALVGDSPSRIKSKEDSG